MFKRITTFLLRRPSYQIFFNNKRTSQVKELQNQIVQLRTLQNDTNEIQQKIQYYHEILQLHEQIVVNEKGICIEYLLDKLKLFLLYKDQDEYIDEDELSEILELDLDDVHYDNLILDEKPEDVKEYYKNIAKRDIHSLKILHYLNEESVEKLQYWCEQFKEAIEKIFEYDVSQNQDRLNISMHEELKHQYMSMYHHLLGKIAQGQNEIQDAIDHHEKSIQILQTAIKIDKKVIENDENPELAEYAQIQLQRQYQQLASELCGLADIQLSIGDLSQAKILRTQALELFQLTIGNQSIPYVITYCGLAYFSYIEEDLDTCYQMIEELYQQIQYSENKEVILQLSLYYFCLKYKMGQDVKELENIIEDLLNQKVRIHDKNILVDYYVFKVEISASLGQRQLTQKYMESAVETLYSFPDIAKARYIIALIQQFKDKQIESPRKLIEQCLTLLENQQFRINLFKDKILDDELIELLLQVEYYILFFQFLLRLVKNIKIQNIVTNFIAYIDKFRMYESQFHQLIDSILDYIQLLKNQDQIDAAVEIINHIIPILQHKQKSLEVQEYLRILTETQQQYNASKQ